MRTLAVTCLLALGALVQSFPSAAQERPLPEPVSFYDAVRLNIVRAQREQNRYAYKERRTDLHTNPFGRIGTGGTRVLDVVPAPDGLTAMRRLIERDNMPISDSAPERVNLPQRREGGGPRSVEDVTQTLRFTIARREVVSGHAVIVITFTPRPNARPTTRQGRLARNFTGNIWVNEAAQEVERVEATAVEDVSFGFGFVARVRKGATVSAERKPVEGGVWMPTSLRFIGEGRAMLFRKLDVNYATDWFDYRLVGATR